jgi:hypothetical protein
MVTTTAISQVFTIMIRGAISGMLGSYDIGQERGIYLFYCTERHDWRALYRTRRETYRIREYFKVRINEIKNSYINAWRVFKASHCYLILLQGIIFKHDSAV